MTYRAESVLFNGAFSARATADTVAGLRERLGGPALGAFVFATPDYLDHLEEFVEIIRVDGHIRDVYGCTGSGIIGNGNEQESGNGFSLLAIRAPEGGLNPVEIPQSAIDSSSSPDTWKRHGAGLGPGGWIILADPFTRDIESWLGEWDHAFPGTPCVGGLASGGSEPESLGVFFNGRRTDILAVGLGAGLHLIPALSQGCRPIGEPLTVTRAEDNVIYALGSRPAYEALESAFQSLSDTQKSSARGNLFAGLANNEYVDDFKAGDFLIRNIIGADPNSGAVVIGGVPRVGQTLQYQLRDSLAADADLASTLEGLAEDTSGRFASLLFSCTGRGSQLFGQPHHDAAALQDKLGPLPTSGIFCNGEIGPIGGHACMHSFTASCGILAANP